MDARPQRTSIGRVNVSKFVLPAPATFRDGLAPTLLAFFAQYAPGQNGATPLVLRVTNLEIGETPEPTASFIADFYAPQPDSSYKLVAHFAQTLSKRLGLFADATAKLNSTLGELLLNAALLGRDQATWLHSGINYPAAYVLATSTQPAEMLPVLNPGVQLRAGFYYSLPEFWYNQPGEPCQPEVESHPYYTAEWAGDREVKPYRRTTDNQRVLATDVWGFSDGQDFYLKRGASFYRLERRGQGFVFHGRIGDDPAYQAAASSRAAGQAYMTGWALAAAAAPSPSRRALFSLSPLTGGTSLDPAASSPPLAMRPAQLFVYRPRNAKGPVARIRLAPGQPLQELAAGDYLTLSPPADQALQVGTLLGTGLEANLSVMPTAEAPIYLEYRPVETSPLRQVATNEGTAALNRLVR
ncbi:hypothetical protein GO988_00910 [Hymenobacter sp. HMF4947]|uniref:Uncharacterized protein n=1 Tax=Hymenobacter ginkgonis TaxID=2682976 RepID=A0A7K1T903_9BACT|nr:hypothetical protein [Hymenobacter ginkgonis]MVN74878.1 hypothetical protein [Hymenobacter ginkgonis]